jgi:hypothetical protein
VGRIRSGLVNKLKVIFILNFIINVWLSQAMKENFKTEARFVCFETKMMLLKLLHVDRDHIDDMLSVRIRKMSSHRRVEINVCKCVTTVVIMTVGDTLEPSLRLLNKSS